MKLIVGLGNPGPQYEKTRHNAGFLVVDRLLRRHGNPAEVPKARFQAVSAELSIGSERCLLLKPTTYMNLSGRSVAEALNFYKLGPAKDLLVIVDEAALPGGALRLRASGSPGGHNGLDSVQACIGTDVYPRLRIGVGPWPPQMRMEDYVLGRFSPEQWALVEPALDKAADAVEMFITHGLEKAMNTFNTKPKPSDPEPNPPGA